MRPNPVGMCHLANNGVVHRDLAARNILLRGDHAIICDFGLSRLIDDGEEYGTTHSFVGPVRWMAPEALESHKVGAGCGIARSS